MNYKTSRIFRGFEKLFYLIGLQVIAVQSSAKKWCMWDWKG